MKKQKLTKKVKDEFRIIIEKTGYWSEETRVFIEQFEYPARQKLHSLGQAISKGYV